MPTNNKNKALNAFHHYIDQVRDHKDTDAALKLCQLFIDKKLSTPKAIVVDELNFWAGSKFDKKCIKCGEWYRAGEPCFVMNKKGWHEDCGTEEDKKSAIYLSVKDKAKQKAKQTALTNTNNDNDQLPNMNDDHNNDWEKN